MARSPSSPIILPCPAKRVSAFSVVDGSVYRPPPYQVRPFARPGHRQLGPLGTNGPYTFCLHPRPGHNSPSTIRRRMICGRSADERHEVHPSHIIFPCPARRVSAPSVVLSGKTGRGRHRKCRRAQSCSYAFSHEAKSRKAQQEQHSRTRLRRTSYDNGTAIQINSLPHQIHLKIGIH